MSPAALPCTDIMGIPALVGAPLAANAEYGELSGMSKIQVILLTILRTCHELSSTDLSFFATGSDPRHHPAWSLARAVHRHQFALRGSILPVVHASTLRWSVADDASRVHVLTWTKSEWLDALDVSLAPTAAGGTKASVSFYATGTISPLPTTQPLSNVRYQRL
eukprot:706522-Rhodomonas_salina.2